MIFLFRDSGYHGGGIVKANSDNSLSNEGLNDQVTSVIVTEGVWTLYEHANFNGRSITVCSKGGPANDGRYPNSDWLGGRNDFFSSVRRNK